MITESRVLSEPWQARLPFFYGWVIASIACWDLHSILVLFLLEHPLCIHGRRYGLEPLNHLLTVYRPWAYVGDRLPSVTSSTALTVRGSWRSLAG